MWIKKLPSRFQVLCADPATVASQISSQYADWNLHSRTQINIPSSDEQEKPWSTGKTWPSAKDLVAWIPDDDSLIKLINPAIQYLERNCFHDALLHLIIIDLTKHYQSELKFQEGKKVMWSDEQ